VQAPPGAQDTLGSPPVKDDEGAARTAGTRLTRVSALPQVPGLPRQQGTTDSSSPLARMALARARLRAVVPLDTVTFVAACPACGHDCEWTQEREETRVRSYLDCDCATEDTLPRTP